MIPALFAAQQARTVRGNEAYDVVVFAKPSIVTPAQRRWLDDRGIRFVPVQRIPDALPSVTSEFPHWSSAALHRLILPLHVAGIYERVLYVDCDTSIEGPLAPLFQLFFVGDGVAAVRDLPFFLEAKTERTGKRMRALATVTSEPERYFNSGVLLIDVDYWCSEKVGERALDYLVDHPVGGLRDQPALNATINGRHTELSPLWNLQVQGYGPLKLGNFLRPAIRHFTGQPKPWMRFSERKGRLVADEDYRRYAAFLSGTPWEGWLRDQWAWSDLRKNIQFEFSRRLRLKRRPREPSPKARAARAEAFLGYCRDTPFVDVTQGIVKRTVEGLTIGAPGQCDSWTQQRASCPAIAGIDP